MPWHITGSTGEFWVVKDETNKPVHKKPHKTKAEALRHLRALYSNVPDARNDKKEVAAVPSAVMGHGAGGLFSELRPGDALDTPKLRKQKKKIGGTKKRETMLKYHGKVSNKGLDMPEGLSVFKDAKGKYRWITFSSNAFRDRDGEIVSTKALEEDVDRADSEGKFGPLRWWHVPGVELGDCDFNMMSGRTLIESGTFRDERIGARLKELSHRLQVSIGFHHPATEPDGDGVFHHIHRFERSLLPAGMASNTLTQFVVKGDDAMASVEEKKEALRALLGNEELVDELISRAETTEKSADSQGIAYKEEGDKPTVSKKVVVTRRRIISKPTEEKKADEDDEEQEEAVDENAAPAKTEKPAPPAQEAPAEGTAAVTSAGKPQPKAQAEKPAEQPTEESDEEDTEEDEESDETTLKKDEDTGEPEEDAKGEQYEEEETEMPEVIGNMTPEEFSGMIAQALGKVMQPYLAQQKEFSRRIAGMEDAVMTRQKEAKESASAIETLRSENDALKKALKESNERIAELEDARPKAVGGRPYIASQAKDTIVDESRVKELAPAADETLQEFMQDFVLKNPSLG